VGSNSRAQRKSLEAAGPVGVDGLVGRPGSEIGSIGGKIRRIGVERLILLSSVVGGEWIDLTGCAGAQCGDAGAELLGTCPNILVLVVERAAQARILAMERSARVKWVAKRWLGAQKLVASTAGRAVPLGSRRTGAVSRSQSERRGRSLERCRIDRGHPNAGFVNLEQVCDQVVEVDVRISKIVEGELFAVPGRC